MLDRCRLNIAACSQDDPATDLHIRVVGYLHSGPDGNQPCASGRKAVRPVEYLARPAGYGLPSDFVSQFGFPVSIVV